MKATTEVVGTLLKTLQQEAQTQNIGPAMSRHLDELVDEIMETTDLETNIEITRLLFRNAVSKVL